MILLNNGKVIGDSEALECSYKVGAGEKLALTLLAYGSGTASFDVEIVGEGAEVSLRGVYLCKGDERQKITVNMRHSVGGSVSNQLFKGIASGKSKAEFDGRVVVAPDAQKTEAYQTNQNLLLSDDAIVCTSPQLEIYADDVKCSHGATVGSLNEDEQFYMRSRGISENEARKLQMLSFLAPALVEVPVQMRECVFEKLESLL